MASKKEILAKHSTSFLPGTCSVRRILGSERSLKFQQGETILMSAEEIDCLQGYGWVEVVSTPQKEVKDGD